MISVAYEIPAECAPFPLSEPLDIAHEALARLDERLRQHALADGWSARQHFSEACASLLLDGELVHLHDLVLRDADADIRTPTQEISRGMAVVRARRLIAAHAPTWPLVRESLELIRQTPDTRTGAEPPLPIVHDPDWDEKARFAQWRDVLRETAVLPGILAAAVAYDAWLAIAPFERDAWMGRQLAAAELRRRANARHHLPALSIGLRQHCHSDLVRLAPLPRITAILKAIEAAATAGTRELERLVLARELMEPRLKGRRASSHLPGLIALFMTAPVVSVRMAAKALKISDQAANLLIRQLAGHVREVSERRSYRLWGIL